MAVYREGYKLIKKIEKGTQQVFSDACDVGTPVTNGDSLWKLLKTAMYFHSVEGTRYEEGGFIFYTIELMDEWAFSDGRKTEEEAIEQFRIGYYPLKAMQKKSYLNPAFRGASGFLTVERVK